VGSRGPPEPREDLSLKVVAARLRAELSTRQRFVIEVPGYRRAAVLVALVEREGATRVVLTLRSATLRAHSGQWSFPGGAIDADDAHAVATAMREAEEEIGIEPKAVEVLGLLSDLPTPTGFTITPVVATVAPAPDAYRPSPTEVAEVLEVPLARLDEPVVAGMVERWGQRFAMVSYQIDGRNIWGATARILSELMDVLSACS
jgi:8-oxo-dGTP pyrophosphatase MutT (NUDIX family)